MTVNSSQKGRDRVSPRFPLLLGALRPRHTDFPFATLTLETFVNDAAMQPKATLHWIFAAGFVLPGILFAGWIGTRRRTLSISMKRRLLTVVAALCFGGKFGLAGCGYNVSGAVPGTYAITIIVTDSANQMIRSAVLNMTVIETL